MERYEKALLNEPLFSAVARTASLSIALGGLFHGMGMAGSLLSGLAMPWWYWAIFTTALVGYEASAVLILLEKSPGFVFAALGPTIGGTMIAIGLLFPSTGLCCLIPGTYGSGISLLGFFTLVIEPMAVVSSILFLVYGPKRGSCAG
jgi:hypothetical protein